MEIGTKLKNARTKSGLTQEKVAEEIGVSRQSVSNWENSRSYPDIVSVIKLSDLYSVSLDELLKEDKNMIRHLADSTNAVASNRRLIKRLTIAAYWVCWAVFFIIFKLTEFPVYHGIGFLRYFPVAIVSAVITALIGVNKDLGGMKWLYVPVTGIMCSLYGLLTWDLQDYLWEFDHNDNPFSFLDLWYTFLEFDAKAALFWGLGCSLLGMLVGTFIRYSIIIKSQRNAENKPSAAESGNQLNQME